MRRFTVGWGAALAGSLLASTALAHAAPAKPPLPIVNTGYADQLTYSSATLSGSISPDRSVHVSYYFQYGQTQAYGSQTPLTPLGNGAETIHVSAAITGLSVSTGYHFRLVAISPGGTTDGADRSFVTSKRTTPKLPLSLTATITPNPVVFGNAVSVQGTLSGTGNISHSVALQMNPFPYLGGFVYTGGSELTNSAGGFSFTLPDMIKNTQLRVLAAGTPPVTSPVVTEFVAVRVVAHVRHTRRHGFARIFGTVSPSVAGARVAFQRLLPGRRPVTVGGTVVTNGTGAVSRFSRVVRIRHAGLYRVFVEVTDGANVSNSSSPVMIR
jgi:hypothetical protein